MVSWPGMNDRVWEPRRGCGRNDQEDPCGRRAPLWALAPLVLMALILPKNGPIWSEKVWGADEREGIRESLRLFDKHDRICGTGRYALRSSDDGILSAEMELLLDGKERIHQKVEMINTGPLQPVSYRHHHFRAGGVKSFEIDFGSGRVRCSARENGREVERESVLEFDQQKTYAGLMFVLLAIHFPRGMEEIEGHTVNFHPDPGILKVRLRRVSHEQLSLGDRSLSAVKYAIQPRLPQLVSLLVGSHFDHHVWVSAAEPTTFLRFEGSLEPGGPFLRIE